MRGSADEGGGADAATDINPEGDRGERGSGTIIVGASAIGGACDAGCERGVHGTIEAELVGGEARITAEVAITGRVDIYSAYDVTLKSMGKET